MGGKTKRLGRGMWSGRRRSAKTGRLSSALGAASPSLSLTKTLLLRKELLDAFVVYIDANSLTALCKAMAKVESTRAILLDRELWRHLLQTHCHVDLAHFNVHRSVILRGGSFVLSDYLSLRSQLERFNRCVQVVEGDLGTVTAVGGQLVECLVFPTSYTYRNPHRGVAGRIHERAGPDLDQAVANIGTRYSAAAGSVKCTVGCGSGMRLLVHCVGPVADHPDSDEVLYKTYVSALLAADSNHVTCAAVASISTGLLRFPVPRAAGIALSAVRDLIRLRPHWSMNVAFICIDQAVYEHFLRARRETVQVFHTAQFAFPHLVKTLSMTEPRDGHAA
ncbi:hypothetical protein PRNP1_007684 [Phytophthora ramorum]